MKTRFAAIAVLAVFVVLTSSAVVGCSSDSDALDAAYTKYYYNQLTSEEQGVYTALGGIADISGTAGAYYFEASVATTDATVVKHAWEALRLDDPFAMCTWVSVSLADDAVSFSGGNVRIAADDSLADAAAMKVAVQAAIDGIEVKGSDIPAKVKSINSILTGKDYKFKDDGASGIYALAADGPHELNAFGFSALFKALCMTSGADMNCTQVYGTFADGSKNVIHAWNEVMVDDGKVYCVDTAVNKKTGDDAWMLAGRYTSYDGDSFGKVHLAFAFNTSTLMGYDFESELLCNDGYEWPENSSIMDTLKDNAHWILIGLICVVLAIYLFVTARKGGIQ